MMHLLHELVHRAVTALVLKLRTPLQHPDQCSA